MRPEVFVTVTALSGGCVGLPLYFWRNNNTVGVTTQPTAKAVQPKTQAPSKVTREEPTSVANGSCQFISLPKEVGEFLVEQKKDQGTYVYFSCSNTDVDNSYIPLPEGWTGAFPKLFMSDQLSTEINTKFELTTEVQQEEGALGSKMVATFSGSGLKNTVEGEWKGIEKEKIKAQVKEGVVSVTPDGRGGNLIYLFIPSKNSQSNEVSG